MWKKRLDEKDKVNFKINDVTTRLKNDCKPHIAQYLTKTKQPVYETWSINRL